MKILLCKEIPKIFIDNENLPIKYISFIGHQILNRRRSLIRIDTYIYVS